jgi:glycosyltransferase involved in cell wall biosynthesis
MTNPALEGALRFLHDHASLLDQRVEVIGEVDLPVVDTLYEDTRSLVLPSKYEGFGFPLAEAIKRRMPVICSDIPAFREHLAALDQPDNVHIVPPIDPVSLAAAMEHFLNCGPDTQGDQKPAAGRRCWTSQGCRATLFRALVPRHRNPS